MTGLTASWSLDRHDIESESGLVMTVRFRPDVLPPTKADWYRRLANYLNTTADLIEQGPLDLVDLKKEVDVIGSE